MLNHTKPKTMFKKAVILISFLFIRSSFTNAFENKAFIMNGDVMIGGLVAIRDGGGINRFMCESNISTFGIIRLEAMRYAVKKVNNNPNLLNGLTLGIEVRDSCGIETRALDESLQFVTNQGSDECEFRTKKGKTIFGVIGDGVSLTTMASASLLRLFKVPLITYGATSTELSDQSKYNFLLRTVPPDSLQAHAMVDFIEKLKWKSVFGFYSTGSYGKYGFEEFVKMSKGSKFCVASHKEIPAGASVDDIVSFVKEFNRKQKGITGIICYCDIQDTIKIVQAIKEANLTTHYQLIASDSWYPTKSDNTVIFSPHYNYLSVKEFYANMLCNLSPNNSTWDSNIWYRQIWKHSEFSSNLSQNNLLRFCLNSSISVTYLRDDKIPFIMDAVYAYAQAIHDYVLKVHNGNISDFKLYENKSKINRTLFFSILKNVKFNGTNGIIKFPVEGHYDITYRSNEMFERIGEWVNTPSPKLNIYKQDKSIFSESSSCQESCKQSVGQKRLCTDNECCWKCRACKDDEFLQISNANLNTSCDNECVQCQNGFWPDSLRKGCYAKQISVEWTVVIVFLSSIGFTLSIVTIVTFIKNNSTPLVRASGREMCYLLLICILVTYVISFLMVLFPNLFTCHSQISLDIFFCICYSSLLIKTNRIARIFSGRQDVSFLTPQWQIVLLSLLVFPQICISILEIVKIRNEKPICYEEGTEFFISIAYNLLIICFTTIYAFQTRKVPSYFNEARDIGFVMYTTILIRSVFLPVFFWTPVEFKSIAIMLDTICLATTLMVGIFARKVYIILFRPDKNVTIRSDALFSHGANTAGAIDAFNS